MYIIFNARCDGAFIAGLRTLQVPGIAIVETLRTTVGAASCRSGLS